MAAAGAGRISIRCSSRRHPIDTSAGDPAGMTASLFVTGTPVVWTGHDPRGAVASGSDVVHAVARPAVDGLDSSVCGQLVAVTSGRDWAAEAGTARCAECARIAAPRRTGRRGVA